ncbi:MAG: CheR family methyltransferase [Phormidesmis sp.]
MDDKTFQQADAHTSWQTDQQAIETLLGNHIGLNASSLGQDSLAKSIARASTALGISNTADYLHHLRQSPSALDALVETVVVPETSFFRNPESFDCLRQHILRNLNLPVANPSIANPSVANPSAPQSWSQSGSYQKSRQHQTWRILSIPCSTGEEPYSIAITLLEAGLTAENFHIDGIDISAKALEKAQQGSFNQYSFRKTRGGTPEQYIQKYFQMDADRYCLSEQVRSQVTFHQGNILDPLRVKRCRPYDVIFCRNLLIYLHPAARRRALDNLNHLLVPNGLLFIGYAETSQIDLQKYASLSVPKAFAYRKLPKPLHPATEAASDSIISDGIISDGISTKAISNSDFSVSPSVSAESLFPSTHQKPLISTPASSEAATTSSGQISRTDKSSHDCAPMNDLAQNLAQIRALADGGQMEIALEQCDRYIKHHPTSAAAYLLLGEIHQSQDNIEQADTAFQKALYLNPKCIQALTHRLQLCEQKGEYVTAKRLYLRLQRLVNDV